jgi:parvulin-like peptidyl-prolyl isomerase
MKRSRLNRFSAAAFLLAAGSALAGLAQMPALAATEAIASVNGEPIAVEDLLQQVDSFHQEMSEPAAKIRRPDPVALLDRIINMRLMLQEARAIGLDELPEVQGQIKTIRLELLKRELVDREVGGITAGDPEIEEQLYRDTVREMEINAVLFAEEEDAEAFAAAVAADGGFEALAAEVIAAGKARGGEGVQSVKAAELRPELTRVLSGMKPGAVSPPTPMQGGIAVIKLNGVLYPEDPEVREMARQGALRMKKQLTLQEYQDRWRKDYTEIDREMLESLDYHAEKPGLEALRADERIVARVKGADPVTVKELTAALEKKAFHGIERAIEKKRVNDELEGVLDLILLERVAYLEAERLGIERSESYLAAMERRTDRLLFTTFVKRVISPKIEIREPELRKHYDDHMAEYSSPGTMRIEGLAFHRQDDAAAAAEKLRRGADLGWMRANADGQADRQSFPALLDLDGRILLTSVLPEGVREAVAGAAAGDLRLYAAPDGPFYALVIREVKEGTPRPYEDARQEIAGRVYEVKHAEAVDDWATKLRAASEIEIFATADELTELLGLGIAQGS